MSDSPTPKLENRRALPKHERLREHLIEQLRRGTLLPGDLLPTEYELAKKAKMSRNTVRLALGDLERDGVIRRVRGRGTYVEESALQRLRGGSDLFALVIPDTRTGYYPSLQRGFHAAAAEIHNQVIVCDSDNDPYRQADAVLQLIDKKVAGVALVPTTSPATPAHQLRPLQERGTPLVFCHRRADGIRAPLVTFSALAVGRMAARALLEHKHRTAAYFSAQHVGLSLLYEEGLRQELRACGGDLPVEFVRTDNIARPSAEHEKFLETHLRDVLGSPKRPTAIFCAFDSEAELVYLVLQRLRVNVPEDISLIGFGGTWREGALARRLTSVAVDEEALGRRAVGLLDDMRAGRLPLQDTTQVEMPLSLYSGETLADAKVKK